MTLLAVHDLTVTRGGLPVLEGVSFALAPGAALVLRGPNGIGKTPLLRTLAGLQPPAAGRLEATPDQIAYAAHADGLKGALSVAENLRFWAAMHGRSIGDAMARMNLAALAGRPASSLSAGQKRRLGLARLLVTGRPVGALDVDSVALFGEVVRAHLAAGGAAVIATHIDLGLPEAQVLDLAPFRARPPQDALSGGFDAGFGEAFS
jgi:heme exporter protein A